MNYSYMSLLLRLVVTGSGIDPLLNKGLTYRQIADLTSAAIKEGYLSKSDRELVVTQEGYDRLNRLENGKILANGNWIIPEVQSQIEKKDIFEIHLPDIKNSYFV